MLTYLCFIGKVGIDRGAQKGAMCKYTLKVKVHIKLSENGVHSINASCCFIASYLFITAPSTAPVNTSIH